jgi:hypothetical protein
MKSHTKVTWRNANHVQFSGVTVSDEVNGYILVAINPPNDLEEAHVIQRAVAGLEVVGPREAAKTKS